jgi:hypothetical protein
MSNGPTKRRSGLFEGETEETHDSQQRCRDGKQTSPVHYMETNWLGEQETNILT